MRLFVPCMLLCGCAATMTDYRVKYCTYEGAFSRGSDDAEYHRAQHEAFVMYCLPEQKAHAENGYRSGYMTTAGSELGRVHP